MDLFEIDNQTLKDLEIFESDENGRSIFSLFDSTSTIGGRTKLVQIFSEPLISEELIADRQRLISGLENMIFPLKVNKQNLELIIYFMNQKHKAKTFSRYAAAKEFLFFRSTQAYYIKQRGIHELLDLLIQINEVCSGIDVEQSPVLIRELDSIILELMAIPVVKKAMETRPARLKAFELAKCDYLFREQAKEKISHILDLVYQLDAYIAVAGTAKLYGLSYPDLLPPGQNGLHIRGAFHLFVENPVANDLSFMPGKNVFFLTGSNMAGKSTLLKSAAICIYLAHLGFPVPAAKMKFSIFHGLMTTINLSDNLSQGYSHFYNEVMRVKEVAQKIRSDRPMVVIFDELFRGTNVKDAYDGSLAIIKAFSKVKSSFFMISTHIVEVANDLKGQQEMDFNFMEVDMGSGKPVFSYRLKSGITEERMGMWIIENEGIVDILNLKSG